MLNGYLVSDVNSLHFKLLVFATGYFVLDASVTHLRRRATHLLEYTPLMLVALLFLLLLVGSNNTIAAFFTVAGFSICLYVLIFSDAALKVAREAGIKYYYLSTFSSGLMIYGFFLVYAAVGTGDLTDIALLLSTGAFKESLGLISTGVTFALIGLLFKLSAFPGHL
jgi:NADH:ubiquinone oxidoreductase subunit 2 (subunit N)